MCARGDDRRKARRLRAESAHAQLELDRDLALGAAREAVFENGAQRLVGELARGADACDLSGVLDLAQPLDGAGARDELPALAEQLGELPVLLDRQAGLVEAEPAAGVGEAGGQRREQVAGDDLALEHVGHLFG